MRARVIFLAVAALMLAGCDTFGLGYVNKLHHPVRIVEHGSRVAQPFTLEPGGVKAAGFGGIAQSIDIFQSDGQLLARYSTRELPRVGQGRSTQYVVIRPARVVIEKKDSLRYDE